MLHRAKRCLGLICPTWASSVQARSLCCAKPLAGLHHRISPSADRVPWSPPTSHTGTFPGKFQLLVIDSSGEWGRRSGGIHLLRSSNTHTHTHTRPLCQQGPRASLPCVPPLALQHLPLPTLGQMHGYRGPAFLGLTELCTDAQQSLCVW